LKQKHTTVVSTAHFYNSFYLLSTLFLFSCGTFEIPQEYTLQVDHNIDSPSRKIFVSDGVSTEILSENCDSSCVDDTALVYDTVIQIARANHVDIKNIEVIRQSGQYGRGLQIWRSHDVSVSDSVFEGPFISGINVNGAEQADDGSWPLSQRSHKISIENNLLNRLGGWALGQEEELLKDHGIYAWGFDDLNISHNLRLYRCKHH
jgi:hypothetical protein